MSDEAHIEAAWQYHADASVVQPWHGRSPDVEAMEREEGEGLEARRSGIQQLLMVYFFADHEVARWENVALRALAVMRTFTPALLVGRCMAAVPAVKAGAQLQATFPLERLRELTDDEEDPAGDEREEILMRLMGYFFRPKEVEAGWLKMGTDRVYLMARQFMPWMVAGRDGGELTYEKLAFIFGELQVDPDEVRRRLAAMRLECPGLPRTDQEKEMDRARSRMSARAQKLIRRPIEEAGGTVRMMFGKRAETREKYAQAAKGNRNRKGG